MNKKQKFENFLESIKGNGYDGLIEGVKQGFKVCFENEMVDVPVISDAKLKSLVYKIANKYTTKFYVDDSWAPVTEMWKEINSVVPILNMMGSAYDNESPPKYKRWTYEGDFKDPNGRSRKAYATVTASGAGSVEDPLGRYDLTMVFSTGSGRNARYEGIEEDTKGNKLGNLTVVNLTPHTIGIKVGENDYTFPSSGKNVRVSTKEIDTGLVGNIVPSIKRELGQVEGLPSPQPDTIYIVSSMVLSEIKDRDDVYAPDTGPTAIREGGQVKAVTRLIQS